ncbi:MAG TPA: polysaccharide deacetylase family protein [Desulfuromonadales bacterium]|nr:polysaccharide deacetylase family protein [Desulfuromonadales bacterium]
MSSPLLRPILCIFLLLITAAPAFAGGHANIMVYHRFGDSRYPSTNIETTVFRDQLAYLKENNYTVITFGDLVRRLQNEADIPERCAVLTIDDAFTSFLEVGLPLLREYDYPATLFVSTGSVGEGGYLSWKQLRIVQAEGIEIGNHSHTHDYLLERKSDETSLAWKKRVRDDIIQAQKLFAKRLGHKPDVFAYPYGEYSPQLQEIVKDIGFDAAAAQQSGVAYAGSDMLALPRFPMGGPYGTLEGFQEKIAMHPLPVKAVEPGSPVVRDENPPRLRVKIETGIVDLDRLNCFVQGQDRCQIIEDPSSRGTYIVEAKGPLVGRRSKYTLTAPGRDGEGWYWYSHLWVQLNNAEERYP